jgi:hypothetical protein
MRFAIFPLLLMLISCGPKEKGRVKITATIYNHSNDTLLLTDGLPQHSDTLFPGKASMIVNSRVYRSKVRQLCCPCGAGLENFTVIPKNPEKIMVQDINDPSNWNKKTHIRIENWICELTIEQEDIRSR